MPTIINNNDAIEYRKYNIAYLKNWKTGTIKDLPSYLGEDDRLYIRTSTQTFIYEEEAFSMNGGLYIEQKVKNLIRNQNFQPNQTFEFIYNPQ